ncbi:cyclic diguanylate phosphodiesterase [Superficieibacter electus]|uniref:cyclic-guanylate-specific phosphodiesterase n=1 Tax=Superficieibacter electus TaxID=2022662 RepID=A0A2P5GNY5_9ENTR|nr:EAL domain-containing protein [Superficieibacter electus]POP44863.1 cyclic diguanylate phosphodiesterase [Superficieibacter electus]POP48250.1 cyclic diguanylate phosphodiesterase [Superficieibacter electus]
MQTAQRIIVNYQRKRFLISAIVALVTLSLTLGIRFISQRSLNQERIHEAATQAVATLDKILLPLEDSREETMRLVGLPCAEVQPLIRKKAAILQTVRSIALVKSGILYCSSIFGARDIPVNQLQPALPASEARLLLSTDQSLLRGSPIMLQWYPVSADGEDGVMESINIELLSSLILSPRAPLISALSLTLGDRHYIEGLGVVDRLADDQDHPLYRLASANFPFTINVSTPGATALALRDLPSQLPLALILSTLLAWIAWLATAGRMSFTWEINLGIAAREFEVFCQPLLNTRNNECTGVEILLRWNNPRQGWISPDVFIPIAEDHNLIIPLTRYVINETVRNLAVFPPDHHFHIGINVAASHLRRGLLLKDLNRYWFDTNPIQQLVVELTERDALDDIDYRLVRELHRKGIKLAIDDFGTGNSSLSWLEKLRPDVLKIDKAFTGAIGTDAVNSTVTDIIIALGQRLNIELVAEGVETEQQATYLRQHNVLLLQGYLYARPMPLAEFPLWLAQRTPLPVRHNHPSGPIMPLR